MTGRTDLGRAHPDAAADPFTLKGILRCRGCKQTLYSHTTIDGARTYGCLNGCRLRDPDAETLERLVYAAAEAADPALIFDLPDDGHAFLFNQVIVAVHVGATADDFTVTWKT